MRLLSMCVSDTPIQKAPPSTASVHPDACRVFFGVEPGTQRVLDHAVNKRTTVERVRSNLHRAREAGILTSASLIVPFPFDDVAHSVKR